MLGLTPSQEKVFRFISEFIAKNNYSPSFREIQTHFQFASLSAVHKHLAQLKKKGWLDYISKSARSIQILFKEPQIDTSPDTIELPIIGELNIGYPIELFSSIDAKFPIAKKLLTDFGRCYAIQVRGSKLQNDHILNQDLLIVEAKNHAGPGDIALVSTKAGATYIKRYFPDHDKIYLENIVSESLDNIEVFEEQDFEIQAIVRFVFRDFRLN